MTLASYRSPKTAVRPSRIAGRGLFADTAIAEGEIVCVKGGHLLTKAEFANYKSVANAAELQIADDLYLAPVSEDEFEGVMMFLNHSCEPNVGIQGQIVFVAIRDIIAGEELTLDYATVDQDSEPMACLCGAKGCRRLITGQDWRKPELQRKYGRFFAWQLMEKIRGERSRCFEKQLARWSPQERSVLESLDTLLRSDTVRAVIEPIVERVLRKLAQEDAAVMAWEPIALPTYGDSLPPFIRSSWVFVLRAGATTGAERHPNSQQRMMSFRGAGDLQTGGEGHWRSNRLVSEMDVELEQRWVSIPTNVWHQAVVPDVDWVVVSFHTVPAEELIEERPDAANVNLTHQRRYVAATG